MRYTTPPGNVLTTSPALNIKAPVTGDTIAQFLTAGGLSCFLVNQSVTPLSVIYSFNVVNIYDFKLNSLKRLLELFNTRYKVNAAVIDTCTGDFTIKINSETRSPFYLDRVVNTRTFNNATRTTCALGVQANNKTLTLDVASAPHVLIAGATGSGKSVLLNTMINSLLFKNTPLTANFIMIDTKQVELTVYNQLPHLRQPIITDVNTALLTLNHLCIEMDNRYSILKNNRLKSIDDRPGIFNRLYIIIDELADLMITSKKAIEPYIVRLAQLGRACGIHLIIATQRPDRSVITGLIKANIPCKIALTTANGYDSKTILNHAGAEKLTGRGHAILKTATSVNEIEFIAAYTPVRDTQAIINHYIDQLPTLDRLIARFKR